MLIINCKIPLNNNKNAIDIMENCVKFVASGESKYDLNM